MNFGILEFCFLYFKVSGIIVIFTVSRLYPFLFSLSFGSWKQQAERGGQTLWSYYFYHRWNLFWIDKNIESTGHYMTQWKVNEYFIVQEYTGQECHRWWMTRSGCSDCWSPYISNMHLAITCFMLLSTPCFVVSAPDSASDVNIRILSSLYGYDGCIGGVNNFDTEVLCQDTSDSSHQ